MAKMKNKAPFVYGLHIKYVKSYSDLVKPLGRKQKKILFSIDQSGVDVMVTLLQLCANSVGIK